MKKSITLSDRIQKHIAVEAVRGCWLWNGVVDKDGYGQIAVRGSDGRSRTKQAHVASYEDAHGPVPVGMEIDHKCRQRACVNPDPAHLEAVTHVENVRRAKVSKRSPLPKLEHQRMSLTSLTAAPYNPRDIRDTALKGLRKSIERFGLVQPIVWNKQTSRIVGGHQRVKALRLSGEKEADVIVVSMSESEEKALNMSLNNPAIAGDFTDAAAELLKVIEQSTPDLYADLRLDALADALTGSIEQVVGPDIDTDPKLDTNLNYKVVVDCQDENHQALMIAKFESEGLQCRALIS